MAAVSFDVVQRFDVSPQVLWSELTDWKAHEKWIPATTVSIHTDPATNGVGTRFTAVTGYGPLALPDRMEVVQLDWDETSRTGRCTVEKSGPVLFGTAGFEVSPTSTGSQMDWFEKVDVKFLPGFLTPIVTRLSAFGFQMGMRKLAKDLASRSS